MLPEESPNDHLGVDCPKCQAASEACKVLGGLGEELQKMVDDGTVYEMGRKAGEAHERAIIEAFFGDIQCERT